MLPTNYEYSSKKPSPKIKKVMKKSLIYLLIVLQGNPAWSVPHFELIDGARGLPGNGQPLAARFRVTDGDRPAEDITLNLDNYRVDFELDVAPVIYAALQPLQTIAEGQLGQAFRRIQATLHYGDMDYPWEYRIGDHPYPLQAVWDPQVNPDTHETQAHLRLSIMDGRRLVNLPHDLPFKQVLWTLRDQDAEVEGGFSYDGTRAYRVRTVVQRWRDPGGVVHSVPTHQFSDMPGHEAPRQVVSVQPYVIGDEPIPVNGYQGRYLFPGQDLVLESDKYPHLNSKSLVYGLGCGRLVIPHTTYHRWQRSGGPDEFTRFMIASARPEDIVHMLPQAHMSNPAFFHQAGLYQLVSVSSEGNERIEKWARVEKNVRPGANVTRMTTIRSPLHVPSIFGMGNGVLEWPALNPGEGEVATLQRGMRDFSVHVNGNEGIQEGLGRVIVLGRSGAGKTCAIHDQAHQETGGLRVQTDPATGIGALSPVNLLPGFMVGHRIAVAGTMAPGFWIDREHNVLFVDAQGFADPAGDFRDVLNAFAINELFKQPAHAKIILTIPENLFLPAGGRADLIKLMRTMVESFPEGQRIHNQGWHDGVMLLVSQGTNPALNPRGVLQQVLDLAPGVNVDLDQPGVRDFIRYFTHNLRTDQNTVRERKIASFPSHVTFGLADGALYPAGPRQAILECLQGTPFLQNPGFKFAVGPGAQLHMVQLAQNLNRSVAHFMAGQVAQRVRDYCFGKIADHNGDVTTLRRALEGVRNRLAALNGIQEAQALTFLEILHRVFEVQPGADNPWLTTKDVADTIHQLEFLKALHRAVHYDVAAWRDGLLPLQGQLEALVAIPQRIGNTLKGMLVGVSDGVTANDVVFAFHAFLADANLTARGANLSIFSPLWNIAQNVTFDLHGVDAGGSGTAAQGVAGVQGHAGGNGGNIFGMAHTVINSDRLTVNLNGGQGGQGQKGGQGSGGAAGSHEQYHDGNFRGPVVAATPSFPSFPADAPQACLQFSMGGNPPGHYRIGRIVIRHGGAVDRISLYARVGRSGLASMGSVGGDGGGETPIDLNPDESLTGINCWTDPDCKLSSSSGLFGINSCTVRGPRLGRIMFRTNQGRVFGPYGQWGAVEDCWKDVAAGQEYTALEGTVGPIIEWSRGVRVQRFTAGTPSRIQARTDGIQGDTGAQGGQGGTGGNSGVFSVTGLNHERLAAFHHQSGAGGARGDGGDGGLGGWHGVFHSEADHSRGRAASGQVGTQGAAGAAGQQGTMTPQLTALQTAQLQAYSDTYKACGADPLAALFVRAMQGLR